MAEVWGALSKAQDNQQTIDEAIAEAIANHESDSSAHLGVGESLEAHKTSEVIDHLANSIVEDKVSNNFFNKGILNFNWPSLDNFNTGGTMIDCYLGSVEMYTTTTLNNKAFVEDKSGNIGQCIFNNDPVLEVMLECGSNGTYESYFGIGDREGYYDEYYAGFKVVNNNIYARTYTFDTENETLVFIDGYSANSLHKYKIYYKHGVAVYFYIDNTLVATISTNMPDNATTCRIYLSIKNTQTNKQAYLLCGPFNYIES